MTSLQSPHNPPDERGTLMFASLIAKVVTAVCALVGAIALLGTFLLTLTGGSPYLQFGLALIFFAMFLVGSYWWMVFGPGRVHYPWPQDLRARRQRAGVDLESRGGR